MLTIRLTRVGKKNSPAFRVVVADKRKAVKRKFIEIVGHYNPSSNPKKLVIDSEKALHWIGLGAQPSDTVNNLLVRLDILPKKELKKIVYGKSVKKKDKDKETVPTTTKSAAVDSTPAENNVIETVTEEPVSIEKTEDPVVETAAPEIESVTAENGKTGLE